MKFVKFRINGCPEIRTGVVLDETYRRQTVDNYGNECEESLTVVRDDDSHLIYRLDRDHIMEWYDPFCRLCN